MAVGRRGRRWPLRAPARRERSVTGPARPGAVGSGGALAAARPVGAAGPAEPRAGAPPRRYPTRRREGSVPGRWG